jgi:hypothetical protein
MIYFHGLPPFRPCDSACWISPACWMCRVVQTAISAVNSQPHADRGRQTPVRGCLTASPGLSGGVVARRGGSSRQPLPELPVRMSGDVMESSIRRAWLSLRDMGDDEEGREGLLRPRQAASAGQFGLAAGLWCNRGPPCFGGGRTAPDGQQHTSESPDHAPGHVEHEDHQQSKSGNGGNGRAC